MPPGCRRRPRTPRFTTGAVAWPTTQEAFGQYIANDVDKWAKLIRAANIKVE